jgi:hypothetical protein
VSSRVRPTRGYPVAERFAATRTVRALVAIYLTAIPTGWAYFRATAACGPESGVGHAGCALHVLRVIAVVAGAAFPCGWGITTLASAVLEPRPASIRSYRIWVAVMFVGYGAVITWGGVSYGMLLADAQHIEHRSWAGALRAEGVVRRFEHPLLYRGVESIAKALSLVDERGVLWYVASNPATPTVRLLLLAKESDVQVSEAATAAYLTRVDEQRALWLAGSTRSLIEQRLSTSEVSGDRRGPPWSLWVSESRLVQLSTDSSEHIRVLVAMNLRTPPSVLRVMAHDSAFEVRAAVAENPRTPTDVLVGLADDLVNCVLLRANGECITAPTARRCVPTARGFALSLRRGFIPIH